MVPCRLVGTNPANFLEARFWTTSKHLDNCLRMISSFAGSHVGDDSHSDRRHNRCLLYDACGENRCAVSKPRTPKAKVTDQNSYEDRLAEAIRRRLDKKVGRGFSAAEATDFTAVGRRCHNCVAANRNRVANWSVAPPSEAVSLASWLKEPRQVGQWQKGSGPRFE